MSADRGSPSEDAETGEIGVLDMGSTVARQPHILLATPTDLVERKKRLTTHSTIATVEAHADVAELADALDLGSSAFIGVEVQVLSSAPDFKRHLPRQTRQ